MAPTDECGKPLGQCISRLRDLMVLSPLIYQQPDSATDWSIGMV